MHRVKRIVFITSCLDGWGGSEELWAGAATRLKAQGFQVLAVRSHFPQSAKDGIAHLTEAGISIKQFRATPWVRLLLNAQRHLHRWKPSLSKVVQYNPFLNLFRSFGAELAVISQGDTYDGIGRFTNVAEACERAGLPYVMVCQKAYEDLWPSDRDRAKIKRAFINAQKVFFVSEHNRRCAQWQLALPLPNAEVVCNPVAVQVDRPLPWPRSERGILRLACLARLWARDKGQDLLLSVLSRPEWRERPLEVNFFGAGDTAQGLEELARMLRLTKVSFCGFTEDVMQVWKDHHALILPSRHEGLPLSLVEAMLCGRFGIVTNAGGAAEVINDGVTGFVAPEISANSLSDAMERAWRRRREWEQIGLEASYDIQRRVPADPCAVFADKINAIHAAVTQAGQPVELQRTASIQRAKPAETR